MIDRMRYRMKVMKRLMPYARGGKRFFVSDLILSVISAALVFVTPLFYKLFVDEVILGRQFGTMLTVAGGYLGVFAAGAFIEYVRNYFNYTLVNTTLYRAKAKIWRGFFARPFEDYGQESIGDMKMRLEDDTAQIEKFARYQSIDYLIAFATLLVSLFLLFAIEWRPCSHQRRSR